MDQKTHIQDEAKSYLISQASFESNLEEFLRSLDERENDAELWEQQLHEEVVFELPFAESTNLPTRIIGKANCLEYIREWYNLFADFKFHDMKVHRLEEHGAYVLEYKTSGFVPSTAKPYNQNNIALIKVRDHKIVFLREYWDPVRLIEAFGKGLNIKSELNFMDIKSIDPF